MKVSIIIPVLNEENKIPEILFLLQSFRRAGHEVIVVDGGSDDNSLALASEAADKVISSGAGRAQQMNKGASAATGDVYLFLHADTILPENALDQITSCFQHGKFWGRFDVRLSGSRHIFRLIEFMMNLRSRLTSIATGDQAIFIESGLFHEVGGYPQIALMEDIAMSCQLRKKIKPVCLRSRVITSSRRWETNGVYATIFLMWKLRLYYFLGMSPQRLARLYR